MKEIYKIMVIALLPYLPMSAENICYARMNQNITLDINWDSDNYGEIKWQISTADGSGWTDIAGAVSPSYTFKVTGNTKCRAIVYGDPACDPIIEEREIRTVNFEVDVISVGSYCADLEISKLDINGAEIVEYGFTSSIQGVGRNYTTLPLRKVGDRLPEGDTFIIRCDGLKPDSQYSLRPYFITSDGSVIYGSGKVANTLEGIVFDTEDWIIEKDRVQVPFSIQGIGIGNPSVEILFGKDQASLKNYNVENLGGNRYCSEMISGLEAGGTYLAKIRAIINGEEVEIEKEVKTWSDYSSYTIDTTVKPVSHIVEWDPEKNYRCLTPELLQVEYPRMCRVDENKLLLTYHGGTTDHWQNSYIRKSYDNGRSWTEPVEIYNIRNAFYGCNYHRICNPEMTKLKNGWIILTVVANGNPEGNQNSKVLACISKDGGETWGDPVIVGHGRTWEPQVVQLPEGEIELLVSSEAYWWDNQRDNMCQEILCTRSTDNGETWTAYKRASYKPGARDGMPVSVVMQDNKGVMFIVESINGNIPPSLQHRALDEEWDNGEWDGVQDDQRWLTTLNNGAGAPHMIQLSTGEFLIMAHTNQTGSVWQTNRPQVIMADNTGHNFKYTRLPLSGNALPGECGAYYNSFFQFDNETVWLLFTKAQYKGTERIESDIMLLEGKIIEK